MFLSWGEKVRRKEAKLIVVLSYMCRIRPTASMKKQYGTDTNWMSTWEENRNSKRFFFAPGVGNGCQEWNALSRLEVHWNYYTSSNIIQYLHMFRILLRTSICCFLRVVEKLKWADFVASAAAREKRRWEGSLQQNINIGNNKDRVRSSGQMMDWKAGTTKEDKREGAKERKKIEIMK